MVRVQAGRLRAKLAEYYASDASADDAIWVELPKGTYVLSFHPRGAGRNLSASNSDGHAHHETSLETQQIPRRWAIAVGVLAVLLAASLTVMAALLFPRKAGETTATNDRAGIPAAFPIFWRGFLTGPEQPWVIFSNARFAGRPDTGMRYYNAQRDAGAPTLDHYTGVGEVLAVHELDKVFALLHQEIRVKRGSLFSLDDAKNNDLILSARPRKISPCWTFLAPRSSSSARFPPAFATETPKSSTPIRKPASPRNYGFTKHRNSYRRLFCGRSRAWYEPDAAPS